MDNLIDENANNHPLSEQKEVVKKWRNIGLGVMGYADMLIKMRLRYGSEQAIRFTEILFKAIASYAIEASYKLAKEKGTFPGYNIRLFDSDIIKHILTEKEIEKYSKVGLRNGSLLSVAPTGSISTILGISGGIEPIFALEYYRTTEALNGEKKTYKVFTDIVNEYFDIMNIPQKERKLENLPDYFVTSHQINWRDRIDTQAVIQQYVDTAISSTINLPKNITLQEIKDLYIYAWQKGLKGVTIYRDGSREGILTLDTNKNDKDSFKSHQRPEKIKADIHNVKILGENWTVVIGLLDNKPFEIFTFKDKNIHIKGIQNAYLIKRKENNRNIYTLESDNVTIEDITTLYKTGEEEFTTRLITRLLRLDKIDVVIKEAEKTYKNIGTFVNVIKRILSKYTEQKITENQCPQCGSKLEMTEGCLKCPNCGYSKCG